MRLENRSRRRSAQLFKKGRNMNTSRVILFVAGLAVSGLAFAHGGGLDGDGCHNDKKAGNYHCHRGPLAGQTFASKADMLKEKAKGGASKGSGCESKAVSKDGKPLAGAAKASFMKKCEADAKAGK